MMVAGALDWESQREYNLTIEATDCVHKTYTWVSYHRVIIFGDKREASWWSTIEATDCVHKTYTWVSYHTLLCLVINGNVMVVMT